NPNDAIKTTRRPKTLTIKDPKNAKAANAASDFVVFFILCSYFKASQNRHGYRSKKNKESGDSISPRRQAGANPVPLLDAAKDSVFTTVCVRRMKLLRKYPQRVRKIRRTFSAGEVHGFDKP